MSIGRASFVSRVGLLSGLILLVAPSLRARARLELNGDWQFRIDPTREGEKWGWTRQLPAGSETVEVPHTWNTGRYEDYEGTAWYFRTFSIEEALLGRHAEIYFGATFSRSRVWLNGEELGGHEGGYTEYHFDVSRRLRRVNHLTLAIDNRPGYATIPGLAMRGRGSDDSGSIWYDWWHYGGIVRDVWLSVGEPSLLRRQQIRVRLEGGAAQVEDRVLLENASDRARPLVLSLKALPPGGGNPVAAATREVILAPGAREERVALRWESPTLWHLDQPRMYRMVAELTDPSGKPVDSISDEFGVRQVEIRDRHLLLNGERVRLSGLARHEDSAAEGLAETRGTMRFDYDDLKSLQTTLTRPVHYPQHPEILRYADRNGILLIPEIPVWQFSEKQLSDPKVIALAKEMMREMIEQSYNHPSILGWSVCNESASSTPGGAAYVKTMAEWIRSLDPDRFVTFADDGLGRAEAQDAVAHADFIMMNQYYGSWHGPAAALAGALDRIGRLYPDKLVVISEFGLPGVFQADSAAADRERIRIVSEQMKIFQRYDWIAGALLWCYQDYKSHRNVWPGLSKGWVDHGVVDANRQRRPSYFAWRELNYPVSVDLVWRTSERFPYPAIGFLAKVSRRGPDEIPSYVLRDYRLTWEARNSQRQVVASGEAALPELGPPTDVAGEWAAAEGGVTLSVRISRPTGFLAFERDYEWRGPAAGGENIGDMKARGLNVPPPE